MPLRKIKLYGKLGKLFGKEWNLDVNSVGEALRAINANTNGKLEQYLYNGKGSKVHYKVCVKNKNNSISKEEINTPYQNGDIFITPIIRGSGKYGQVILGVVLVIVGVIINYITFGSGSPIGGYFIKAGVALALGGVAQMLMPNPKVESVERKTSYLFQGNAMTVNQGMAVGTIYGRALVNPMPISISADNIDQNSYEGEIINIGAVGLIDETLILYSYKAGTATLCGFDEFTDISTPPKKYLKCSFSGTLLFQRSPYWVPPCTPPIDSYQETFSGAAELSPLSCSLIQTGTRVDIDGVSHELSYPYDFGYTICAYEVTTTKTSSQRTGTGTCCGYSELGYNEKTTGSQSQILSEEDTELNAIARLLPTLTWSAWQSTPIYPYYYRNPSNFNIAYRAVRTKSITLPGKYNPSFQYKYSATIQRRVYGSSDPWVNAETISTIVTPQSDGTLILPELEIPNESGYESKITSPSINYA